MDDRAADRGAHAKALCEGVSSPRTTLPKIVVNFRAILKIAPIISVLEAPRLDGAGKLNAPYDD